MTPEYTRTQQNSIFETALGWRAIGVQAMPATEDGLKTVDHLSPTPTTDPIASRARWAKYRDTFIPEETIRETFSRGRTGLAVITGVGFRDDGLKLGMIEIDDPGLISLFLDTAESGNVDAVLRVFRDGYVERTPGGGLHAYYLCSEIPKNTKLAQRPAPTNDNPRAVEVLIETRGTGGLSIVAGSHGQVHPSGKPYVIERGALKDIPVLEIDDQSELFAFSRIFDEMPVKEIKPRVKDATVDGDRPGDRYNDAATMETFRELLAGWDWLFESGGVWCLRRPGKDRGISATWNWDGRGRLRIFTSSTSLEPAMYSAFALYTHLHHGGDWGAAAKALYAEGHGKRPYTEFDTGESGAPPSPDAIRAVQLSSNLFVAGRRFYFKDGFNPLPLSNAEIRISHYITEEIAPGEYRYLYRMVGTLMDGTPLPPVDIPTEDLADLHRWTGRSGPTWARVTLEPGLAVRDQVRACIQHYSQRIGTQAIQSYSETGWCHVEGEHVFRTHLAAIGKDGIRQDVQVQLGADFSRYTMAVIPSRDQATSIGRKYLRLLDLGPAEILAPLLLTPARAVLGEFMRVDSLVYLYGLTGVFKTELSVLMMSHFGPSFTSRSIPLNFEGTSNSTQAATWRLKDVVTAVDDMAPDGSRNQVDTTFAKLGGLARTTGNGSGRTRSNADMTAKQTFFPRGVVIASGEDMPRGHSATARMQVIEVTAGAIDATVLSDCQEMASTGVFAQLTAAFIQYVAGNWEEVAKGVDALYKRAIEEARSYKFKHRRTADAIAPQIVAAQVWFEYLRTIGSVTKPERDALIEWIRGGLFETGAAQDAVQAEANPAEIFVSNIRSVVVRGDAHLADRASNECPLYAARFGWKTETRVVRDHLEQVSTPKGSLIGWVDIDANAVLLDPDSAYAVAQDLGNRTGRTIPTTVNTLGKRLLDSKLIVSTEAGRVKQRIYVNKQAHRVWHLKLSDVFPEESSGQMATAPLLLSQEEVA